VVELVVLVYIFLCAAGKGKWRGRRRTRRRSMSWWVGGLVADGGCTGRLLSFPFYREMLWKWGGVGRLCI